MVERPTLFFKFIVKPHVGLFTWVLLQRGAVCFLVHVFFSGCRFLLAACWLAVCLLALFDGTRRPTILKVAVWIAWCHPMACGSNKKEPFW